MEDTKTVFRWMELWRSSLQEIEGRFGNAVRSYFVFLRWLFILNFYIFLLVFTFICIPEIVFENHNASSTPNSNVNGSEQCAYDPYKGKNNTSISQYVTDFLAGKGFLENTLLFYGYYENTVKALSDSSLGYNVPVAFVVVTFSYFLLSLILIVRKAGVYLKESMLSGEIRFHTYCNKVFAGWDFCITDEKAVHLKHSSLKYELETDIEDLRMRRKQAGRTTKQKIILYTKRFVINIFVLGFLAGSLVAIYVAAAYQFDFETLPSENYLLGLLVPYLVAIVITIIGFLAPRVCGILVNFEDYSTDFAINITLVRTVLLRLVSVMFLYIVVYFRINCDKYRFVNVKVTNGCGYCEGFACWETHMGQEMYKLTLLDFIKFVVLTLLVEFPKRIIVERCDCSLSRKIGRPEFDIRACVLDLVYSQTVLWIGTFYAPMLPVIAVIKFFVFFQLKKLTLLHNYQPALKPYRTSRSGSFFFLILIFGFAVAALPVGVSLAIIPPSRYCGPFRGLPTMFGAVVDVILTLPEDLTGIFWFIGSGGFAFIVGVILCLIIYYYVALKSANRTMISLLKDHLTSGGKDKQYLLQKVNDLQKKTMGVQQEYRCVLNSTFYFTPSPSTSILYPMFPLSCARAWPCSYHLRSYQHDLRGLHHLLIDRF